MAERTNEDLMGGHPATDYTVSGEGPEDQEENVLDADDFVSVTIGGQEYVVHKDAAGAIEQETQKRPAGTQPYSAEELVRAIRNTTPHEGGETKKGGEGPTDEQLAVDLVTNPNKVLGDLRQDITKTVTQELTTKYQGEQRKRAFWEAFYKEHDDLADHKMLVNAVASQNRQDIEGMDVVEGSKKLADLARKYILSLRQEGKSGEGKDDPSTTTEVPGTSGRKAKKAEDEGNKGKSGGSSLSSIIKDRQAQRARGGSQQARSAS